MRSRKTIVNRGKIAEMGCSGWQYSFHYCGSAQNKRLRYDIQIGRYNSHAAPVNKIYEIIQGFLEKHRIISR